MKSLGVVLLGAAAVVSCCGRVGCSAEPRRPNIIVLITDDQGWGDLSCHGNPVLETPHLDAMASRGATFSRFYVSPVCSPTRASLMTGRYNHRTGVIDTFKGGSMMRPDEVTLAEALKQAGYSTAIFGKWHLGDCYPMRAQDQGFDRAVVFRGGGLGQPSEPPANERRYTNPILYYDGQERQADGYCTDVYFDEAMRFIEQQAENPEPFFAYIATNTPHSPYHDVPDELYQKYKARDLSPVLLGNEKTADTVARVYAMVENIDQNVGRLVSFLDKRDLTNDTLVLYLCDNGPNTPRYAGHRRGMKTDVHDGGIASPLFVNWPGRVAPGTEVDALSAHIDLMPTLLEAASADKPAGVEFDGRSLLPLLEGADVAWPDRKLFIQAHRGLDPLRGHHMTAFDKRWKLVRSSGFQRHTPAPGVGYELYDLRADPTESKNLLKQSPSHARDLRAAYDEWFNEVSKAYAGDYTPPRIVIGAEQEPETVLTWQDWQTTGDNWGTQGYWLLTAPRPAAFRVRVLLESASAGTAELTIGDATHTLPVENAEQEILFPSVEIPAGDASLQFRLVSDGQEVAPYQVYLSKLETASTPQ
ncbi:Arylsulfatase precursor [Posidoniimonas polymericola]|uniref:Arylsulfatase n=1 Tax=Posidoniimonas polymericola TaxID=2528002 RepID=A0A5C5YF25_9BACT|nr:arylsulfatase [Posidoniimonas polymericola]TWT73608.1 Arylsulfatase precursor [Posidoniimonas polymericola]